MEVLKKRGIIKKIKKQNNEIIIFIEELHMIIGTEGVQKKAQLAFNVLKPSMARGKIHLIGAITDDEYCKFIDNCSLERQIQKIKVDEPTIKETLTILRGIKEKLETFHKIKIENDAFN